MLDCCAGQQAAILKSLAETFKIPVVVVNQVSLFVACVACITYHGLGQVLLYTCATIGSGVAVAVLQDNHVPSDAVTLSESQQPG